MEEVLIQRFDHFGRGICYIDSKICFVDGALPGEVVEIEITKEGNNYIEAKVINIIKESPLRIKPKCKYFSKCGGCNFQNISFNEENKFKEEKVKDVMCRYGNVDLSIIKPIIYHNEYNYRNKIILHGSNGILGLYEENTHNIVPIDKCLLVDDKINDVISILNSINTNITDVLIQSSNDSSCILVSIRGEVSNIDSLKDICNVIIYNGKLISKDRDIISTIGSKKYHISAGSFFQVNNTLTEELYNCVLNIVSDIKPSTVLDLYCGTGTIGIYVSEYSDKIIGIDYNKTNITDAKKNKELNNTNNIEFICDKVENRIDKYHDIDLVIVDPPRSGLDNKTKNYLKTINSKTIIYVSCDPVTLARDIKDLSDTYNILSIQPFNMFPKTYHVESVCILERR